MPFVIVKLEKNEMIGTIELEHINHISKRATLVIMLEENKNRGNGYETETVNILFDCGFNYLN